MGVLDFLTGKREKPAAEPRQPQPSGQPAETGPPPPETYTVRGGDSLWAIAERHYGNGRLWQRIFEANRAVIGDHPDNVRPGMILKLP